MSIGIIYNISGISGRENINYYISCIKNILNQSFKDYKLVISSCLNDKKTIECLYNLFSNQISINWIKDKIPVNCSFNFSVSKLIEKYGDIFDCFLYLDSGVNFLNQENIVGELYNLFKSGPYGMVTARTNTNTGFPGWFGIGSHDDDTYSFNNFFRNLDNHFIIPLGKACNLHAQIFSNEILKEYERIWPDIWASEASESVFSFLNAGINKKWIIHKDIEVYHQTSLDGPSSGFPPIKFVQEKRKKPCLHGFCCDNILERIQGGKDFGLGFEEISGVQIHNPDKFDENGYSLDQRLKSYIKENLYLQPHEFDYNKINYKWIN